MTNANLPLTARAFELLGGWKQQDSSHRFQKVLFEHESAGTAAHTSGVLKYVAIDASNSRNHEHFVLREGYRVSMVEAYLTVYLHRIDEVCTELLECLPAGDCSPQWKGWDDRRRLYAFQYALTALLSLRMWVDEKNYESKLDAVLPSTFEMLLSNYCSVTIAMQDRDPANIPGIFKLPGIEFDTVDKAVMGRFINGLAHYLPPGMESDKFWHHLFWTLLENNNHLALRKETGAHQLLNHMTHVEWDRSSVGARVEHLEKMNRLPGHRAPDHRGY